MAGSKAVQDRLGKFVESTAASSTGTLVGQAAVLRAVHFNDASGGTAGSIVFKDGGSGGTTKLTINTPGAGSGDDVLIPGGGIPFDTDIHVTLTQVDGVTIFYYR